MVLHDINEAEREALRGRQFSGAFRGKQTWSRWLVESYFQHWSWYNPNAGAKSGDGDGDDDGGSGNGKRPNLMDGWAYFEHFTLPRRFEASGDGGGILLGGKGHHIRAPPGEVEGTELYGLSTPMESLSGEYVAPGTSSACVKIR